MASLPQPSELKQLWADPEAEGFSLPAVEFYGHSSGPHKCFSNFFEHEPFPFSVPAACGRAELEAAGRSATVMVTFTEKAIMLCKAAVMGDFGSYDAIARATTPRKAKALGRKVGGWKQSAWDRVVCLIAVEVATQKFSALPALEKVLLGTGERVIAEMTRNDHNWGTGVDVGCGDETCRWPGTNILGWSLMVARAQIRKDRAALVDAGAGEHAASKGGEALQQEQPK